MSLKLIALIVAGTLAALSALVIWGWVKIFGLVEEIDPVTDSG